MKIPLLAVMMTAGLIALSAAGYAEVSPSAAGGADGVPLPMNQKSTAHLLKMKEQKEQLAEAQKAKEEGKALEKEKKGKLEKLERKTGRKTYSWQVLNR